ncbi:MAG: DUF2283 domain-containing protein [Candidatus Woesearchaeota archaeon]|nr:DUF2283 domain-containing protein [Candidatus Woesearchaeota archaeon]
MKTNKHLDAKDEGEIIYDYAHDILTFKIKNRNYKQSVEFHNFVADIDDLGFVTGVRIFDASRIFGVVKYTLKNIIHCDFKARLEKNALTIQLKFVGKARNKLISLLPHTENFTQQITTAVSDRYGLADSYTECAAEA